MEVWNGALVFVEVWNGALVFVEVWNGALVGGGGDYIAMLRIIHLFECTSTGADRSTVLSILADQFCKGFL